LETNQFHDEEVGRTALDKLITLLQSRHDYDGYFLYMKSSESNDPYELIPLVEYKQEKDQSGQTYQLVAGHSGKLQNSKSR